MKKFLLSATFLFCVSLLWAQSNKEKYEDASDLVQQAIQKLRDGSVIEANRVVDSSFTIYPSRDVVDYARELFVLSNNSQAYHYLDKLYETASALDDKWITVFDPANMALANRSKRKVTKYPKWTGVFHIMLEGYNLNREFGNRAYAISVMKKMAALEISKALNWTTRTLQQDIRVKLAIAEKRFDDAFELADDKEFRSMKAQWDVFISFSKGDYAVALEKARDYRSVKLSNYENWKFVLYTLLNDERVSEYNTPPVFNAAVKNGSNEALYYLGLIQLNNKNYDSALALFNRSLTARMQGKYKDLAQQFLMDRWVIYKSIGDAYAGLKQYEKAKDNYNIAIFSDPGYEPAIAALTKLESSVATEVSTDKTPPTIVLTEPSLKRGLQVTTAGVDILVKGTAQDPSGLRSVTVNGQPVYTQSAGDFWGSVTLKDGLNKITIKATDGAGNAAEETFEITKNATTTPDTDVIPVVAREGKNYCLLIAAQNYKDASIPSLDNPIQDAVRLKIVLKQNYNFSEENIITLFNPDANDIQRQLLELTNMIQPEDNLLIFYAGHGIWVEKEKKGYWLMTDAKRNDPNTWISNKDILNLIAKLPSRHTLLITDACFSGGVFKTRAVGADASAAIKVMDEKISRVAITSGNDTEVPDESVFMRYLVKALTENKEKYMPAQKMFISHIMEAVMTETKTEPRYGTLELAGHIGGDYIFIKK